MKITTLIALLILGLILFALPLTSSAEPKPLTQFMQFFEKNHASLRVSPIEQTCLELARAELASRSRVTRTKEEPEDWIFSETTDKGLVFLQLLSKKQSYVQRAKEKGYEGLKDLVTKKSVALLRQYSGFKQCTQSKASQLQACASPVASGKDSLKGCLSRSR